MNRQMTRSAFVMMLDQKRMMCWALGALLGIATPGTVEATPSRGGDCASCHGSSRNAADIEGFDMLTDGLPTFEVTSGDVARVVFDVFNPSKDYAIAVNDLDRPGVEAGTTLEYSVLGSEWRDRGSYYTSGEHSSSRTYDFELQIAPGLAADLFLLEAQVAGGDEEWHDLERFYLRVLADDRETLLAAGSAWKYLDDGSDLGTAWRAPEFVDAHWHSGPAQLGYGDGDEQTEVGFGDNSSQKHITTYFRTTFDLAEGFEDITLSLLYDDGAAVYLNGARVALADLDEDAAYNVEASDTRGGTDEDAWVNYSVNPEFLLRGRNVLAAEVHQSGPGSSDISFDLKMLGHAVPAPHLTWDGLDDGNWDSAGRWNGGGGVPDGRTDAVLQASTITISGNASAYSVLIDDDARLLIANSGSLATGGPVQLADGVLEIVPGSRLDAGSDFTMTADSELATTLTDSLGELVTTAGDVELAGTLTLEISGASMFQAGTYTLISSSGPGGILGTFALGTDLHAYVSQGAGGDGLHNSGTKVTLTLDFDLNPGDADLSTATDLSDFNLWNANKFMQNTDWATGDFDGNGATDLSDFNIWNGAKFTTASGGAGPAPTQVPEPGVVVLLGIGAMCWLMCRRTKTGR